MRLEHWLYTIPLRLRSLFRRNDVERELDDEIRFHLERQIAEDVARGVPPDQARRGAIRALDGIDLRKEECRDMRRINLVDHLAQDVRYALRSLSRNPGFALLAILVMALGIGANTAVFSVVNAVLLKPLPYGDPDRIVTLSTSGRRDTSRSYVSAPDFHDWHHQSRSFAAMAYYKAEDTAVMHHATAEYAHVARVSAEFFDVLSVRPFAGRLFSREQTEPGSGAAALVGYEYWQDHFAGNTGAVGQTIRVFGKTLAVVGVLPPRFQFPDKTEIWIPTDTIIRDGESRGGLNRQVIARLKTGVSLEQAQAGMDVIAARLEKQYPATNEGRTVAVVRMRDDLVQDVRLTLLLLLAAVAVVLLIACSNIATLLLAKATARTREIAIRASLGASRSRIVRQLITENLLLALLAGSAGLLLAFAGSASLVKLAPSNVPRLSESQIDTTVLVFTFGICVLASLLFGLVPALYATRVDLNDTLKQGAARVVAGGGASTIRHALVVAEIALSVILLTGAGLLIKSFVALHNVALGFRPEHVLVMDANVPSASNLESQRRATQLFKNLLAEISVLPGVSSVGATMVMPGHGGPAGSFWGDFMPSDASVKAPFSGYSVITPGTFGALGIPLKSGRDFDQRDTYDAPFTAIVSEALVRRAFPRQDPLGHVIFCGLDDSTKPLTIVGVVGNVRRKGPASEPAPEIYLPYEQHPNNATALKFLIRSPLDTGKLSGTLRQAVHKRSPDVPLKFTTMEASLSENLAAPRFRTLLLGIFAGLAICLAMAGIYGVLAYIVGQRANEIGLRMALGASTTDVLALVLQQGIKLTAIGFALGLVGSFAAGRVLTSVLFEVNPGDPATYAAVAALLVLVTLAASYFPARRATKIDPLTALRQE